MCVCLLLLQATTTEPIYRKIAIEIDHIVEIDHKHILRLYICYPEKIHGSLVISENQRLTRAVPQAT